MPFFDFQHFRPQKPFLRERVKPPQSIAAQGIEGVCSFLQIWPFFEIISRPDFLSPAPRQRENFGPYFEEKHTWHCLLWRRHFKIEQQKFFLDKTVKTCSICPIIAQKTSVSISAAFSTWENMTFRGKIFYIQKMPLFEPEMPKTRTNAAKKFSAKGAVTSRQ